MICSFDTGPHMFNYKAPVLMVPNLTRWFIGGSISHFYQKTTSSRFPHVVFFFCGEVFLSERRTGSRPDGLVTFLGVEFVDVLWWKAGENDDLQILFLKNLEKKNSIYIVYIYIVYIYTLLGTVPYSQIQNAKHFLSLMTLLFSL